MLGELNKNEIDEFLKRNSIGRIGFTDGDSVYIVPTNYRYVDNTILCYSLEGLKIDIMRKHSSVCFEVDEIINPDEWKCVVINGVFEEITDKGELDLLRPHYTEYRLRKTASLTVLPSTESEQNLDKNISDSAQVFYRICFVKVSGRFQNGFS